MRVSVSLRDKGRGAGGRGSAGRCVCGESYELSWRESYPLLFLDELYAAGALSPAARCALGGRGDVSGASPALTPVLLFAYCTFGCLCGLLAGCASRVRCRCGNVGVYEVCPIIEACAGLTGLFWERCW